MPRKQRSYMTSQVAPTQSVGTSDNTIQLSGIQVPTDGAVIDTWSYNGRADATAPGAVIVHLRKRGTATAIADTIAVSNLASHVDNPLTAKGPGSGGAGAGVYLTQGDRVDVFFDHTTGSPTGSPTCTLVVNWLT